MQIDFMTAFGIETQHIFVNFAMTRINPICQYYFLNLQIDLFTIFAFFVAGKTQTSCMI